MIKMLYNGGTSIYKFGNNTYPQRIRRRLNLGHIFQGKKCVLWAGKYTNCTAAGCLPVHLISMSYAEREKLIFQCYPEA